MLFTLLVVDRLFGVHASVVDGVDRACRSDPEPRTRLALAMADDGQHADMVRGVRLKTVQRYCAPVAVHLPRPRPTGAVRPQSDCVATDWTSSQFSRLGTIPLQSHCLKTTNTTVTLIGTDRQPHAISITVTVTTVACGPIQSDSDQWRIPEFTQCSRCKQHETEKLFSLFLNEAVESQSFRSISSRFQARDAATEKFKPCHQSSDSFLVYDQRTKSQLLDERSDDREGMSEAGVNRLAM